MTNYINYGNPVDMFHGITANKLLRRSFQTLVEEDREKMAYVASLMHAGEPITESEWAAAESALHATEAALIAEWKEPVPLNRHGQPAGGIHPAIA